jgi:hypothetical protein
MWWFFGISSIALLVLIRGTGSPQLPPVPASSERHVNDEPLPDIFMPANSPTRVISDLNDKRAWATSTSQTFQGILS